MAGEPIAGRYRLVEPLGRGSMSSVWLAEDEELGRRVAVKMLAPTADRARFDREARAVASLSHPNVCALWAYGEADGRPYMVLEYLEGGTLEDRLAAGRPLDDGETARIAREVASGLAQAHARGLVHRDLKPANILFDGEGRAKIADFGIARMGADGLTETGTVLGTASTISPEQAAGEPAGPASDVYSFGAILFRMLTGRLPFTAANALELVRMHRDEPAPPVAAVRADAPARLAAVADAALLKDPALRPPDGTALVAALAGGVSTPAAASAEAATQIVRPARPARRTAAGRRGLPVLAVGVLVAALAAGGGLAAWLATRPAGPSEPAAPPPTLVLPTVSPGSTAAATTVAPATTTAPTTTRPATTTAPPATTAVSTTTEAPTTTRPAATTTAPRTTTAPATTAGPATTTEPAPTTEPATTTEPSTTDTTATTTAAAP